MRIVVTGGGTGGHIYPAIAVAGELKKRRPGIDLVFIGTRGGIEANAVPAAGFPIEFCRAAGLSLNPVKFLKFTLENSIGVLQVLSIFKKKKTDLVIGAGGFVSAPVLYAAEMKKIPFVLLEQNVLPGKVNRVMAKKAMLVMAAFEESATHLPRGKTLVTGNPIRGEIMGKSKEEACEKLDIDPGVFTVLITGGSQGARAINQAVIKALPRWDKKGMQIIHLAGRKNYDEVKTAAAQSLSNPQCRYICMDYSEDMASLYAASDLVICRSGASTLAEITALGKPSILIPYPHAADNHQEKNARGIEKAGGALVLTDNEVNDRLASAVEDLADNRGRLESMADASLSLGKPRALKNIVDEIERILDSYAGG